MIVDHPLVLPLVDPDHLFFFYQSGAHELLQRLNRRQVGWDVYKGHRHVQRPKSAVLDGEGRILQLWMGCGALFDMQADHYEPIAPPRTGL